VSCWLNWKAGNTGKKAAAGIAGRRVDGGGMMAGTACRRTWMSDAFDQFWESYPSDLCQSARNKGSKGEAKKVWEKIDPDLYPKIMSALDKQIKFDRLQKQQGAFVARWKHACRWLRNHGWEDEIDQNLPENRPMTVYTCACGSTDNVTATGRRQKHAYLCQACYRKGPGKPREQELYEELKKHGLGIRLGESREVWALRCRDHFREQFPTSRFADKAGEGRILGEDGQPGPNVSDGA